MWIHVSQQFETSLHKHPMSCSQRHLPKEVLVILLRWYLKEEKKMCIFISIMKNLDALQQYSSMVFIIIKIKDN